MTSRSRRANVGQLPNLCVLSLERSGRVQRARDALAFSRARMKSESTTQSENSAASTTPALDENRLAWLALALSPGLGPKRILDAVKQLDTASQIFTLPLTDLEGLRFPAQAAQYIFDGKARRAAEEFRRSAH